MRKIKLKVVNHELKDEFIVEADFKSVRKIALEEMKKRKWNDDDCYSYILDIF